MPATEQTRPLLDTTKPGSAASTNNQQSTLTSTTTNILGAGRFLFGAATVIAPIATCKAAFFTLHPSATLVARLLGVREVVIGGLTLFTARRHATALRSESPEASAKETQNLRSVLWANIFNDASDVAVCLTAVAMRSINPKAAIVFGGGAGALVLLGELGIKGL
ncbi:hypothetical protein GQ53DRAFT_740475 [Thozetella sp. PMI_491]|nr:hypothetical protein GQ53DRAFT_740475 [Thozetella sp. PMI_491]